MLRDALQAYQRAQELDPGDEQIRPLLQQTTQRLVHNLDRQGSDLGKEADEAKDARTLTGRRQQAIAKYDDAVQLDPTNTQLAAARQEQVKKMASLLVDQAEKQAAPALQKADSEVSPKDQNNLEQAAAKLNGALGLDATNVAAADLSGQVQKKLAGSYVTQGEKE